jgi:hypothetical protein
MELVGALRATTPEAAAAERLKMCSDCRVVDMYSGDDEVRIQDIR